MKHYELRIERLHAADGDHDDLGWYSKGHHQEADFRAALEESFWIRRPDGTSERFKHPSEVEDETKCRFVQQWWRITPHRILEASPNARGAFPVTAMLSPESSLS